MCACVYVSMCACVVLVYVVITESRMLVIQILQIAYCKSTYNTYPILNCSRFQCDPLNLVTDHTYFQTRWLTTLKKHIFLNIISR